MCQAGAVITRALAETLRAAGLSWAPANGDRFVVPDRDLDDQVFVISDMVIESLRLPRGNQVLAFNGTTEWALDSLEASEAIWLPREDQLRDALGEAFMSLELIPGATSGFAVSLLVGDTEQRFVDVDVESAYARAVLALLESTR
jgi:hypothetical protein